MGRSGCSDPVHGCWLMGWHGAQRLRAAVRQIGPGNDQRARVLSARMVAVNRRRCRPNSPSAVDQNPPSRLEQPPPRTSPRRPQLSARQPDGPITPALPSESATLYGYTWIQRRRAECAATQDPASTRRGSPEGDPTDRFAWWHARRPEQSRPGATTFPCRVQRCNRAPLDVGHPLAAVCFAFIVESDSWRLVSRNRSPLALLLPPVHEPPPLPPHPPPPPPYRDSPTLLDAVACRRSYLPYSVDSPGL